MTTGQENPPTTEPEADATGESQDSVTQNSETQNAQGTPFPQASQRRNPDLAGVLANRLLRRDVTAGDLAELRRMNPQRPAPAIFWRLMFAYRITDPDSPQDDDVHVEQAWAHILAAIADGTRAGTDAHTGPHNPAIPLGSALAQAGYQPARLDALLSANPGQTQRLATQAAQFLHSNGPGYNCSDLARLMLSHLRSPAQLDADRIYIARSFHRTNHNLQNQE